MTHRHVIAIHDVAPSTMDEVRELRRLARAVRPGPVALLIVPCLHGDERWPSADAAWLRAAIAHGDEPVLHGLTHAGRQPGDERELRGLCSADASHRLQRGLEALAELGVRPAGVIPPCYAQPREPAAAVRAAGLAWWADRRGIRSTTGRHVSAPAIGLGASTTPRRLLTPPAARVAAAALAGERRIRIDLHPADLRHRRLRGAAEYLLQWAAGRRGHATRHAELLLD